MRTDAVIKALPKDVADKIAAGEVVERPLSVVKELVENSLDAGASAVTVEIRAGGRDYIRVTDDGSGIPRDQMELAFRRYATSKIETKDDLFAIGTLGFRGEALASIAAVTRTDLLSRTRGAEKGAKIEFEGGVRTGLSDAACEEGTTIVVRDMFFNVPARRKFLKAENTESSLVADYVSKMALAYPGVRFRFISNGSIMFSTPGKGSLRDAIMTVYSPVIAKGLIDVDHSRDGMRLWGCVSAPDASRPNKRRQAFFVNGRWVKSSVIDQAVAAAYSDKLFSGRYPVAYLFLEVPPESVDVNVHPQKTEVKFDSDDAVRDFCVKAIRMALLVPEAAPDIAVLAEDKLKADETEPEETIESEQVNINTLSLNNAAKDFAEQETFFSGLREKQSEAESAPRREVSEDGSGYGRRETERPFSFASLEPLCQIFSTYIIAKDGERLYIVDQHAAHERIMFEDLLSRYERSEVSSQTLMVPIVLHLDPRQQASRPGWEPVLTRLGYRVEDFGPSDISLREIPSGLSLSEAEDFASSILEEDVRDPRGYTAKLDQIISAACKAAVKGGDRLSPEEMKALFSRLDGCANPFSCPHGRPTFLRFSESEIARYFKR